MFVLEYGVRLWKLSSHGSRNISAIIANLCNRRGWVVGFRPCLFSPWERERDPFPEQEAGRVPEPLAMLCTRKSLISAANLTPHFPANNQRVQ